MESNFCDNLRTFSIFSRCDPSCSASSGNIKKPLGAEKSRVSRSLRAFSSIFFLQDLSEQPNRDLDIGTALHAPLELDELSAESSKIEINLRQKQWYTSANDRQHQNSVYIRTIKQHEFNKNVKSPRTEGTDRAGSGSKECKILQLFSPPSAITFTISNAAQKWEYKLMKNFISSHIAQLNGSAFASPLLLKIIQCFSELLLLLLRPFSFHVWNFPFGEQTWINVSAVSWRSCQSV